MSDISFDFRDGSYLPPGYTSQNREIVWLRRSPLMLLPFALSTLICAISWLSGGVSTLTDLGFMIITIASVVLLLFELAQFTRRFGIGGVILFGGILIWFCYDYVFNWLGLNFASSLTVFSPLVLARAAFWHSLFILMMVAGLLFPSSRFFERVLTFVPEPNYPTFYFFIAIALFIVGISPYFFFNSDAWYIGIYKAIIGGRTGERTAWTVGRTGNLNYSWGAYLAVLLQLGQIGALVAAFYSILVCRSVVQNLICWSIWGLQLLIGIGSGTRGEVVYMFVPIAGLFFIKYQARAVAVMQRFSKRAYITSGFLLFVILLIVQIQARYRSFGFGDVNLGEVSIKDIEGTVMFSTSLRGFQLVPNEVPVFYNNYPGEGFIRAMPDQFMDLVIGAIPRALWPDKPIDPIWEWYNRAFIGSGDGRTGTTIAAGLVGRWYFAYGLAGVLQGGLLMGWLFVVSERALGNSLQRPMGILLSMSILTWLFRSFRSFSFLPLYPVLIGGVVLWVMIKFLNLLIRR